ncbi:MAG: DUF72 domain-containing protein [Planctomycetota bacterium]
MFVGTSGWTYGDWVGEFYPPEVKGAGRLGYYARHFDTVEVNVSFYRVPTEPMVKAWNAHLPPGFHLVLKGTRLVTHRKRLADCQDELAFFLERVQALEHLKLVLWQLPPSLGKKTGLLARFLESLPDTMRHAVEFRHPSWWSEDVHELLGKHRAAFVAVSHPTLPDDIPPTADFLYLRFHGLGEELHGYEYREPELRRWVERVEPLLEGRVLYAFFNNDRRAHAVRNALLFRELLGEGS